jgi:hypothetical protein
MAGQFYDNPERTFIHLNNAVTTTAAALAEGVVGPAGKVGRVTRLEAAVTTVYVGTDTITLDTNTPSLASVPSLAITGADNAVVRATPAQLAAMSDLPADSPLNLSTDGLSTSGVASISLQIDWY